jgi:hypothetical protein
MLNLKNLEKVAQSQTQSQAESSKDDELNKPPKKAYGRLLIAIVIVALVYEYYIYVFEVKLREMKSIILVND